MTLFWQNLRYNLSKISWQKFCHKVFVIYFLFLAFFDIFLFFFSENKVFFSIPKPTQPNKYTNRVVTLWYRPPELLLGERNYGPAIDVWGAGCVMAEMWTRTPIMQGKVEQDQLQKIQKLCGGINPETWENDKNCQKVRF